jgi:hypothetical protein
VIPEPIIQEGEAKVPTLTFGHNDLGAFQCLLE